MSGKAPKFFCEHCGNEVKRNTKVCPHCGSFFVNVRCPACGFIGNERSFLDGCPNCGYAIDTKNKASFSTVQSASGFRREKSRGNETLPAWIYILVATLFAAAIASVFFIYR
jgi:hypothetical protein